MNNPLFKIDFTKWRLLKQPETGKLFEPVPSKDFDRYEYWSDQYNRPIRQVFSKTTNAKYSDHLDLKTATLYRSVSTWLGASAYDDEINKQEYEELCQIALLKYHFTKHINYEALLPYQSLALKYFEWEEGVFIKKTNGYYVVNYENNKIEKQDLTHDQILVRAHEIGEYQFYYRVMSKLIEINGSEFLDGP